MQHVAMHQAVNDACKRTNLCMNSIQEDMQQLKQYPHSTLSNSSSSCSGCTRMLVAAFCSFTHLQTNQLMAES
jgi:hypothetical protein